MTKRFTVALRKGSVDGPIVAATDIITLAQGNGSIAATDFVDGRLSGRVPIEDNVGSFSKFSLAPPTTTTTTTTTIAPGPAPSLIANIVPTTISMDGISTAKINWNASRASRVTLFVGDIALLLGNTSNISSNIAGNITVGPYTNSDQAGTINGNIIATGPNGIAWQRVSLTLQYPSEYIDISPTRVSANASANLTIGGIPNTSVTITSNSYIWTSTTVTLDTNGKYTTTLSDTNVGTWQYQAVFAGTGAVRRKTYSVDYAYQFNGGTVEASKAGSGGVAIGGGSGFITANDIVFGILGTEATINTDIEYQPIIEEYVPVVDITTGESVYVKVTNQDGSPYTSTTQEVIVQKDDDGNTLYLLPDGTMILENPDGEVISTTIGGDPTALEKSDYSDPDLLALRYNPDESPFGDDPKLQSDSIEPGTFVGHGSETVDGVTGAGEFGSEEFLSGIEEDLYGYDITPEDVDNATIYIPSDTKGPEQYTGWSETDLLRDLSQNSV